MTDRIFKAMTRPAMVFGVPMNLIVVGGGLTFLLFIWGIQLFGIISVVPVLSLAATVFIIARVMTINDPYRIHHIFQFLKIKVQNKAINFWGARTYTGTTSLAIFNSRRRNSSMR